MWSPTCSNNTTTMCQKAVVLWIWGYLLWTTNIFKTIDFKSIPYRTSSQWHSSVFSPSIHSKNVSEENTDYQANSAFKTHSHFGFIFHVRCLSIETSQNALKNWSSHQRSPCTPWSSLKHGLMSVSGPMSHVHFPGCLTSETLPFRIWYNMN